MEQANTTIEDRGGVDHPNAGGQAQDATCAGCGRQFKRGVCAGGGTSGSGRYYHFSVCQHCTGCSEEEGKAAYNGGPRGHC